jgi:transcriptional regulator with XRE-family HTH domain
MSEVTKAYGEFIRNKRTERGMTQGEVAKKLGTTQQAYGRYEQGLREPEFDIMIQISAILDFKPSEFFDGYMAHRYSW